MVYTVKQLADLAGVSRRTLHYYDEIGLLHPSSVGENGYRYYDEEAVLRLQQILFFRELGFSLDDIRDIVDQAEFDVLQALRAHKQALRDQVERLNSLIHTIDKTMSHLKGEIEMNADEMFQGFTEEEEKHYAQLASERYDPQIVKASYRRWNSYSAEKKAQIKAEGGEIYRDLIALIDQDPASAEVQQVIARWHQNLRYFYEPTLEILRGLGQGYADDPAFATVFEKMHPNLPEFLRDAITYYCEEIVVAA